MILSCKRCKKYYSEENLLYLCNRDSGTALTHRLADLVGIYVISV